MQVTRKKHQVLVCEQRAEPLGQPKAAHYQSIRNISSEPYKGEDWHGKDRNTYYMDLELEVMIYLLGRF